MEDRNDLSSKLFSFYECEFSASLLQFFSSLAAQEIERRRMKVSVVGIPKTIDNDIGVLQRIFMIFLIYGS